MTHSSGTGRAFLAALIVGAALFTALVIHLDAGKVFRALYLSGWGLLWVAFAHFGVIVLDAQSLRVLLGPDEKRPLHRLAWMWWIGYSMNALLPVMQVGGDLVRARLLSRSGIRGERAGATVVVGLTAGVLTLLLFAATGGVLLAVSNKDVINSLNLFAGLAAFGVLLFGFYLAQQRGLFLWLARALERLASGREWLALVGGAEALDGSIVALYRNRTAFIACCLWRLAAWIAGVAEVWLALFFLGHPVSVTEAFILESLGKAIRSAGFAIPGALGVQEGGFLVLGISIGVPGEVALSLSLMMRVRDILLGLPGLAVWQYIEGAGLIKRRLGPR